MVKRRGKPRKSAVGNGGNPQSHDSVRTISPTDAIGGLCHIVARPVSTPAPEMPTPMPMPARVGDWELERELGSGGMGTVYLGRHVETGAVAAVKVLPPALAREKGFIARFNREVAALQKLKSPHIVELLDSGEDDGTFYFAMEYVPGETLTDRLEREKRLSWREAIEFGVQVCRALKAAHNCGIIHRDLKPSNLLLHVPEPVPDAPDAAQPAPIVKLTDFGIAQVFATSKLTVTGGILGTAEYMSPEQAQGKRANKQSDIYSLGAVLYVMVTGRPPFTGKTTLEIVQKHRFAQFDSPKRVVPEIPHWLDEIICKCLAKKPEDRYPDAYVLGLRLQEVPRKVDLKEGRVIASGAAGPDDETMVDGRSEPREDEVGGTLVRDLFQAQMEAERSASRVSRLFDNVWFLLGLLVVVIAGGFLLAKWNQPQAESLFERGESLMARPEGPAWETARRDYFLPLLELDEEEWSPRVAPYLRQIELYELKRELLGRDAVGDAPPAGPEAILRQAMQQRKLGRTAEARETLSALTVLLEGDADRQQLHALAVQLLEEFSSSEETSGLDYVRRALKRADELYGRGETAEAVRIWRSVQRLYRDDPDAEELIALARKRELEAAGNDPSKPQHDD
jgi:hypothetical protein